MFGIIFFSLLVCLLATLYFYFTRNFNYWKNRGVEFIPPTVGFGNLRSVFTLQKSIWQAIEDFHKYSDAPYTGIFRADKPILLIRDLDIIKDIFITDFGHFSDRDIIIDEKKEPLMGLSLLGMKGEKWRNLRAKLTPTFTTGKIKNMLYLIRECCEKLDTLLQRYADSGEEFEAKSVMSRYTMDTITTCAFGIEGKNIEDPNWPLSRTIKQVMNPNIFTSLKLILMNVSPLLLKVIPDRIFPKDLYETMDEVIWDTVKYREAHNIHRNDYLDTLMELRKESRENKGSDLELDGNMFVAQAFFFFLAGFETGSTMMSLLLYQMTRHPEIQDRLRNEIIHVLDKHNNEITYEALKEMTYLDQVINETLRMYPTLPLMNRVCVKDYKIPGTDLTIEKGIPVFFSAIALHNDPNVFENPEMFDPDRFSKDRINKYHKCSFMPFGEGPRNCIGKRFGLMQTKAAIAQLFRKYEVQACASTPKKLIWNPKSFVLGTKGDLPLILKRIKE